MEIKELFARWLEKATEDADVAAELAALKEAGDEEGIQDRFYRELEFGTGGLRGVIGAGSNRMNIYNIRKATQGLANYLNGTELPKQVAIGYDSRIKSDVFARETARVLAANGITAWLYPRLEPTPALSWAVRYLGCGAGVCVTASHNPAKYNGYKVYGADGCQITLEAAKLILGQISQVDCFEDVKLADFDAALAEGGIRYIPEECLDAFVDAVYAQRVGSGEGVADLKLVYTPLNGAGLECVEKLLKKLGVTHVDVVEEQRLPDGNFPTCPYPNPEKKEALELALRLGEQTNADIVVANDPDCDRMGAAVRTDGGYRQLTGNEVGVLLCDYVLSRMQQKGILPRRPVVVKTIVTTPMVDAVCKPYDAEVTDVLTGFKYIGNAIKKLEDKGQADRYVFGFEESCGYLKGTYVRDKDGVVASMLLCQCAAYHKKQGKTLADRLAELEEQLGTFLQQTVSYAFGGVDGAQRKEQLFVQLRQQPFAEIADSKVKDVCDFLLQTRYDLPKSNVLRYDLEDGGRLILRPSGTEPIVKAYIFVRGSRTQAQQRLAQIKAFVDGVIK